MSCPIFVVLINHLCTSTAPADSAIRYEKKRLWRDIDGPNPFTGKPRPEFDQAWRDIIAREFSPCIKYYKVKSPFF